MLGEGMSLLVSGYKLSFAEKLSGLSVSYARNMGLVTGKTSLVNSAGRSASAKFAGVILPGWYDCGCGEGDGDTLIPLPKGVPFMSGSVFYTDVLEGVRQSVDAHVEMKIID